MPKTTPTDTVLDLVGLSFPQVKHEQDTGNKRYLCPACGKPAIVSARIGPRQYVCPVTQQVVTAVQVVTAPEIAPAE